MNRIDEMSDISISEIEKNLQGDSRLTDVSKGHSAVVQCLLIAARRGRQLRQAQESIINTGGSEMMNAPTTMQNTESSIIPTVESDPVAVNVSLIIDE